jgi:hypothetical protein
MEKEFLDLLKKEGYYNVRYIKGKGYCGLRDFLFTVGLCYGIEQYSYAGRYCYPKVVADESRIALEIWSGHGDPVGSWLKHKGVGGEWSNPNINTSNII